MPVLQMSGYDVLAFGGIDPKNVQKIRIGVKQVL
jgi:hypothetical protein